MKGTLAFTWGPSGGLYLHRRRVCLWKLAVTFIPGIEIDDMMEAWLSGAGDKEQRRAELGGVTAIVTRSEGADGAPLVFVDTDDQVPEGPRGPRMRIRLNDAPVFVGEPYQPREEQ